MSNDSPMVSVIVPVYNSFPYLKKCLNSILSQTYSNFELICIDDGSSDGSQIVLDEYEKKDKRVIVIHKLISSGSAAAPRNIGIERAKGKYVLILDSDDWFDDHLIGNMVYRAEQFDSDLVMCDNYVVVGDKISEDGELHHAYLPDKDVFLPDENADRLFLM